LRLFKASVLLATEGILLAYWGVFWKRPGQIGAETGFRARYYRRIGSLLSRIGCWGNFGYLKARDVISGRVGFITIGVGVWGRVSQIGSKPPSEAIYYEKRSGCGNDIMCARETEWDLCAFTYGRVTGVCGWRGFCYYYV